MTITKYIVPGGGLVQLIFGKKYIPINEPTDISETNTKEFLNFNGI